MNRKFYKAMTAFGLSFACVFGIKTVAIAATEVDTADTLQTTDSVETTGAEQGITTTIKDADRAGGTETNETSENVETDAQSQNKDGIGVASGPGYGYTVSYLDYLANQNKNVLQDGIYQIGSAEDETRVVDVSGGSKNNSANVQLYQMNQSNAQGWRVTHDNIGYVTFTNVNSGKVLDVSGAQTNNGTNVQQYAFNNSKAQKWIVQNMGTNYKIMSALKLDMVLDLKSALLSNGTNIQLYQSNDSDAQRWAIYQFTRDKKEATRIQASINCNTLQDGEYQISSKKNGTYFADVSGGSKNNGGNVQIYRSNGSNAQWWKVSHDSNGFITFTNKNSGKVLDVSGGIASNSRNVQQYASNNTLAQKWIVFKTKNGYEIMSAMDPSYRLDISGGSMKNSSNMQLYKSNNTTAQAWVIQSFTKSSRLNYLAGVNRDVIKNGSYRILSAINQNYDLDVSGGSKNNGANVQLYKNNSTYAQSWILTHDAYGFVSFTNNNSGKVLDVAGGRQSKGTNVQQYDTNSTNAQKWIVLSNLNGYEIISALDENLVLDLTSGKVQNTQNIQIYTNNESKAQRWLFVIDTSVNGFKSAVKNVYYFNNGNVKTGTFTVKKAIISTGNLGNIYSTKMDGEVTHYGQDDYPWGNTIIGGYTIGENGCLPTAATSAINFLKGTNYTPVDIANLLHEAGYYNSNGQWGTDDAAWKYIAEHFGLTYRDKLSVDELTDELRKGNLVGTTVTSYFTDYYHAILLYGYDAVLTGMSIDPIYMSTNVCDPGSKSGTYGIDFIAKNASTTSDIGPYFSLGIK